MLLLNTFPTRFKFYYRIYFYKYLNFVKTQKYIKFTIIFSENNRFFSNNNLNIIMLKIKKNINLSKTIHCLVCFYNRLSFDKCEKKSKSIFLNRWVYFFYHKPRDYH